MQYIKRDSGTTTRQILCAKKGAVYICPAVERPYTIALARRHNRQDLVIVTPIWLESWPNWVGREISSIILDHAVELTARQTELYTRAVNYQTIHSRMHYSYAKDKLKLNVRHWITRIFRRQP